MPKIPTFQRRETLTTQAPSVRQSVTEAGRVGGAIARAGAQLSGQAMQAYESLDRAQKYQQEQDYKLTSTKGINDILFKGSEDNDNYGDLTEYEAMLVSGKDEALSKIANQTQKDLASVDYDLRAESTKIKLSQMFKENMIDKGRTDSLEMIENYQKTYAQIPQQSFLDAMNNVIDQGEKAGYWDKEYAHGLKTKSKENIRKMRDMNEKQKKKNKKIAEEELLKGQTQAEGNFLIEAISGRLVSADIIDSETSGNVSLGMAKTAQMIMLSLDNIATRESDSKTFNTLISDYLSLDDGDLEAMRKFRIKVGTKYATGNLIKEDALSFINRTIDPLIDFELKKKKKGFFGMAVSMFKDWAKTTSAPLVATYNMTKELINRIENGTITDENINEQSQEIINNAQEILYPEYKIEDLEATARETGLTVSQVVEILGNRKK